MTNFKIGLLASTSLAAQRYQALRAQEYPTYGGTRVQPETVADPLASFRAMVRDISALNTVQDTSEFEQNFGRSFRKLLEEGPSTLNVYGLTPEQLRQALLEPFKDQIHVVNWSDEVFAEGERSRFLSPNLSTLMEQYLEKNYFPSPEESQKAIYLPTIEENATVTGMSQDVAKELQSLFYGKPVQSHQTSSEAAWLPRNLLSGSSSTGSNQVIRPIIISSKSSLKENCGSHFAADFETGLFFKELSGGALEDFNLRSLGIVDDTRLSMELLCYGLNAVKSDNPEVYQVLLNNNRTGVMNIN